MWRRRGGHNRGAPSPCLPCILTPRPEPPSSPCMAGAAGGGSPEAWFCIFFHVIYKKLTERSSSTREWGKESQVITEGAPMACRWHTHFLFLQIPSWSSPLHWLPWEPILLGIFLGLWPLWPQVLFSAHLFGSSRVHLWAYAHTTLPSEVGSSPPTWPQGYPPA